jgi:zinc transport system substrate-binding protein
VNKFLCILLSIFAVVQAEKKVIGVSLHPYFSFTTSIAGDLATVTPFIKSGNNPHGYLVQPKDIERAMGIDIAVINGVGHDEFAVNILKASGLYGKIPTIYANEDVALIPISTGSEIVNSHTFVSISASIQQVYTIANGLSEIDPTNAMTYRKNASAFARELRVLKAEYLQKLSEVKGNQFRCATIHGGYSYLLQEFGFQVDAVIEPGHGLTPSAADLRKTIDEINANDVQVVFSEQDFPSNFVETIKKETGVSVVSLSHLSSGEFTKDSYIEGMRYNLNQLLKAVQGE